MAARIKLTTHKDILMALLVPALVLFHLFVAPYSKVEESFNIQATHDILTYGIPPLRNAGPYLADKYDHFEFPGPVPRTFVGPLILAKMASPFAVLVESGKDRQILGLLPS